MAQPKRRPSPPIAERISLLRREMKKQRTSALLVTNRADYFYLTGFTGEDSAVLLLPRAVHVITDGRFVDTVKQECPWARRWIRHGSLAAEIGSVCRSLRLRSLGVQGDHVSVNEMAELKKQTKIRGVRVAPSMLAKLRSKKSAAELVVMRVALRIAEEAFEATKTSIRIGQTELEIAARLEFEMKKRGASAPAFPTICAEGPNAALPHAQPGRRRVKAGSAILLDWGARARGYCSDLTRMVFVGSMPRKLADIYGIVLEAQRRAIDAIRPGRRMCEIDAVARDWITEAGYGTAFSHGLGHGLGIDVHEAPALSWRSEERLEAGMLVTVEPGIYLTGVGGVRIEDDVLVTASGRRVLSRLPRRAEDAVIRRKG